MEERLFVAAKAFILHEGRVLVVRESAKPGNTKTGQYTLVGGRLRPGESVSAALQREVREEVGLSFEQGKPLQVVEWYPQFDDEAWHVVAVFFECRSGSDAVALSKEHDDYKWIDPKMFKSEGVVNNEHVVFKSYLKNNE